jgi:hypothetical protein
MGFSRQHGLGFGAFSLFKPMYVIDHFLETAISTINAEFLESGSLTLVQGFCLLSNLSEKRNKPNSGSVYMGECAFQRWGGHQALLFAWLSA